MGTDVSRLTRTAGDVISTVKDGRLRLILNRPLAMNALTPDVLEDLVHLVFAATEEQGVSLVTIEGAGTRAFSAGFDIKVLHAGHVDARKDYVGAAVNAIRGCGKPTLALIQGYCLGAGLDLALACDFRIATANSRFAIPANRLSIVYDPRGINRILNEVGVATVRKLFILGKELDAHDATTSGLVSLVVHEGELEKAVADWANLTGQSGNSIQAHKKIIRALVEQTERADEFWAPLTALRTQAIAAKERQQAIKDFVSREKS